MECNNECFYQGSRGGITMWYVIVGVVCLLIGGTFGLLAGCLCRAARKNDLPDQIEYRVWPK